MARSLSSLALKAIPRPRKAMVNFGSIRITSSKSAMARSLSPLSLKAILRPRKAMAKFGSIRIASIEVGDGAVVVALGAITVTSIGVVSRQIASFPFPLIDALCTVNDRSLGVLRTITLVGGG